jgi:hypothetical protein
LRAGEPDNSVLEKSKKITGQTFVRAPRIVWKSNIEVARQRPDDGAVHLALDYHAEKLLGKILDLTRK